MRNDGRKPNELRPLKFEMGYIKHHPGSVLVQAGNTKVLVVATSEARVPHHRLDIGGWLSAEYNMLPAATNTRNQRPISKLRNDGRSVEISRLIGRSLRQAIDLNALGQRTLTLDCDVIQADAGTRSASITGAYLATCAHIAWLIKSGQLKMVMMEDIIKRPIAAISLGVIKDQILLDLNYQEDIVAESDCNVVGSHEGQIIEFQCTAEQKPMTKDHLDKIFELSQQALKEIFDLQKKELLKQCGIVLHH
jgi:ribonuclease PH